MAEKSTKYVKPKVKKSFTSEEEDKIIEFYSKNEQLWDPKHSEYKIGVKSLTIQTLVQELNNKFTAAEIHHRFSGMRSTYRANVNRVTASTSTGSDGGSVYVPTWPHYDSMKFLDATKPTRTSLTSFTIHDSDVTSVDYDNLDQLEAVDTVDLCGEDETISANSKKSEAQQKGLTPSKKLGGKRAREDDLIGECLHVLRTVSKENVPAPIVKETLDRCKTYGEFVAASLKQMTDWNQIQAMGEISTVLIKYDRNNPNST